MADSQYTEFEIKGLYTSPNRFSKAPPGSLAQADNCVVISDGVLEPRRGVDTVDTRSGDIAALANFNSQVTAFRSGTVTSYTTAGSPSNTVGSYSPNTRTAWARGNESLLFTSASGVKKIEALGSTGGTIRDAGAPEPLLLTLVSNTTGVSNADWLLANNAIAYRATLARFDANGYLLESSPTVRLVVTNSLGSKSTPTLRVLLPAEITTASDNWLVRLYRGVSADQTVATDPSDECYQCWEIVISAADIAVGYTSITDTQSVVNYNFPLYTNANTGAGIEVANDIPPVASDICQFKSFTLYSGGHRRAGVSLNLLGVGDPGTVVYNGIFPGATVNVGGYTFTAYSGLTPANQIASGLFYTSWTGTVGQNLETTAKNLCAAISQYFQPANGPLFDIAGVARPDYTHGYKATYVSGYGGTPGQIYIESTNGSTASFTVVLNTAPVLISYVWSPTGNSPGTYTATLQSDNDLSPAKINWSNNGLPEAVPLDNWALVGDPSKSILRVVQCGQTAFIFKQNDGVWTLTGSDPSNFDIRQFDASINLVAANALAVMDGAIFCFTTKGVEVITEAGKLPSPISEPIDREILALRATNANFDNAVFIATYESEGQVMVAVPASLNDPGCSLQYIYDTDTEAWTRWTIPALTAATVCEVDNKLWLGAKTKLKRERKTLTSADYSDDGVGIVCTPKFNPLSPAGPTNVHQYRNVYWSFANLEPTAATSSLYTDRVGSDSSKALAVPSAAQYGWGNFAWGNVPFEAQSQNVTLQHGVPPNAAAGNQLNLSLSLGQAGKFWQLQGLAVLWEAATTAGRS